MEDKWNPPYNSSNKEKQIKFSSPILRFEALEPELTKLLERVNSLEQRILKLERERTD